MQEDISLLCVVQIHTLTIAAVFLFYCFILSPHSGMLLRAVKGSWGFGGATTIIKTTNGRVSNRVVKQTLL